MTKRVGRLRLVLEENSNTYHPVFVFFHKKKIKVEGVYHWVDHVAPLRSGDRLIIYYDDEVAFNEKVIRQHTPPLDLKFFYGFIPVMKNKELDRWLDYFRNNCQARLIKANQHISKLDMNFYLDIPDSD